MHPPSPLRPQLLQHSSAQCWASRRESRHNSSGAHAQHHKQPNRATGFRPLCWCPERMRCCCLSVCCAGMQQHTVCLHCNRQSLLPHTNMLASSRQSWGPSPTTLLLLQQPYCSLEATTPCTATQQPQTTPSGRLKSCRDAGRHQALLLGQQQLCASGGQPTNALPQAAHAAATTNQPS